MVLTRTPFDPKDLPDQRLASLALQSKGGKVSEGVCDEVLLGEPRTEMDSHFDPSMHDRGTFGALKRE
jgi:hypothetical protein